MTPTVFHILFPALGVFHLMLGASARMDGDDRGHDGHDQAADQKRAGEDGCWLDESENDESPHTSRQKLLKHGCSFESE